MINNPTIEQVSLILNDPSVFPDISLGQHTIDIHKLIEKSYPIWFPEGGFLFTTINEDITQAEVHTALLPSVRGRKAITYAQEAKWEIFIHTTTLNLFTRVQHKNKKADMFTRWNGFKEYSKDENFIFYKYDIYDWVSECVKLEEIGKRFLAKVSEFEFNGIFPKVVGVFLALIRAGQTDKAFFIYNTMAFLISAPAIYKGYNEIVFEGHRITLDLVMEE